MAEESVQPEVQDNNQVASQTGDIDKLFNVVSSKGLYTKSKDEFRQKYSTPESIDKLFQVVSDKGLYTKSKGDFYSKYYPNLSSQPKTEQQVQPIQNAIDINQPIPIIQNVPKETSPYLKGLDFKTITDAIKADKSQQEQQNSTIGALYNSVVGGLGEAATGFLNRAAQSVPSSMGSVGGAPSGTMAGTTEDRAMAAKGIALATSDLIDKARTNASSRENEQSFNFDTNKGIIHNAKSLAFQLPRLAVDLGLGALTGGGSFFAQGEGAALEELKNNPEADKLTPNTQAGYVTTVGIVNGVLMKLGFDKIFKATGLEDLAAKRIINEVTSDLVKKGVKATTKDIEDAALRKATSFMTKANNVGIGALKSTLTGGGIGVVQAASDDAIKLLVDKASGVDVFNSEDIKENFPKHLLTSVIQGGATGLVMGLGHGMFENTNKAIRLKMAEAKTPQDIENIKQNINQQVESGNITPEQAQAANIKIQDYAQIAAKIPEEITSDRKYAIIGGIEQREGIKNEIQSTQDELNSTDEAFQSDKNAKLELLNAKLLQTNDYIDGLVTGEKTKYSEENGVYYKTDANGDKIPISKQHYELGSAAEENDKKQTTQVQQPTETQKPTVEAITEVKPTAEKTETKIVEATPVVEKVKPEGKVEHWFSQAVGNDINKSLLSDNSKDKVWGIQNNNGEYEVSKITSSIPHEQIEKRQESVIKPLFDQDNIYNEGDKINIIKPAKLQKNADGSFSIREKGLIRYGEKELPKEEVKPTETAPKEEKTAADTVHDDLLTHLGITEEPKGETKPAKKYTSKNIDTISEEGLNDTQKKVVKDVKNVVKAVSKLVEKTTGNPLEVNIHETPSSYEKAVIDAGGTKQDSTTKGFYLDADGTIHLNMERVTTDTMLHEGFHPVLDYMAKNRPDIIDNLHSQLEGLKGGKEVIDNANKLYEGSDATTIKKEAITDFIAKVADGTIKIDKTNFQKVKDFFVNSVNKLGFKLGKDINTITDLKKLAELVSEKFNKGKEIEIKDGSKANSSEKVQFQSDFKHQESGIEWKYFKNSKEFKKLVDDGYVTFDKNIDDFKGAVVLHAPDAGFSGQILKDGQLIADGKGGMYYPMVFHENGDFWAATSRGASKLAETLNEARKKSPDGKVRMVLISAPIDKLMSSSLNGIGLVDILTSKAFSEKSGITPEQLRKAIIKGIKTTEKLKNENKDGMKPSQKPLPKITGNETMADLHIKLKDFYPAENSDFPVRKSLNQNILEGIASYSSSPKVAKQLSEFLGAGTFNEKLKSTGGKLSRANLTQGFSNILAEPTLRGEQSGKMYAIIELGADVKPVKTSEHESYPYTLRSTDANEKPTIHILSQRDYWYNHVNDENGNSIADNKEKQASMLPASAGISSVVDLNPTKTEGVSQLVEKAKPKQPIEEFGLGYAPYRERNVYTLDQDKKIRNSASFKLYQENVKDLAKLLNINISDKLDTWGGYVDFETNRGVQEVSNIIRVLGTKDDVRLMAAAMGKIAPQMQDSILAGTYDANGEGIEHIIKTGNFDNANKALKYFKEHDLQYFSIDKKTGNIIIIDFDNSNSDNIINFTKKLNENGIKTEHEAQRINAEFIESKDYDGILNGEGSKIGDKNRGDINAFIEDAKGKHEKIAEKEKNIQFSKEEVKPTETVESTTKALEEVAKNNPEKVADATSKVFEDAGFHRGTLSSKSDFINETYIGDLPFTGHYFVSNPKDVVQGGSRKGNEKAFRVVDFSKYNLLKFEDANSYFGTKRALKKMANDLSDVNSEEVVNDLLKNKNVSDRLKNKIKNFNANNDALDINAKIYKLEKLQESVKNNRDFNAINNEIDSLNEKLKSVKKVSFADNLKNILEEYKNKRKTEEFSERLETSILKSLGYEGVDVRGIKAEGGLKSPDGFSEGSVIFDLKPKTVSTPAEAYHDALKVPEQNRTIEQKEIILSVDKALGISTKQQFSKGDQDSKIKDFIEIQRQKGISDKDIQAGLEKASEKIGIDKAKIDELMSTPKVEQTGDLQSQYDGIKSEKAKKKFITKNFGEVSDEQLSDIVKNNKDLQTIKDKIDAIQKSGAGEVLQPTPQGNGSKGGKRGGMEQGEQGATITTEKEGEENGDGQRVGISHKSLTELADKLGLEQPERGDVLTPEEYSERGKLLIKNGADPIKAAEEFKKDNKVNSDIISVARAHFNELVRDVNDARIKFGIDSEEYKKSLKEANDWAKNVVKPMGTAFYEIGSSLQGQVDLDTGNFVSVSMAVQEKTGKDLSTEQTKEVERLTTNVSDLNKKIQDLEKKLTDTISKGEEAKPKAKEGIKEKSKEIANVIRKGKLSKPDIFSSASPASLVWDAAIEITAKTVEVSGDIAQSIADGLEHIKNSDWYKNSDSDKQKAAQKAFRDFVQNQDIKIRFAEKKDNKFTTEEAKSIWEYAKEEYLDKGSDYREMLNGVSKDLGLNRDQVRTAISQPKGAKEITDEMYRNINKRNSAINEAKQWVEEQGNSKTKIFLKAVPSAFFKLKTFGHGTVGGITHAGTNIFQISKWKSYFPFFAKQFKYAFGDTAKYEMAMEDLKNDPQFTFWQRAGLAVDPKVKYDDYQGNFVDGDKKVNGIKKLFDRLGVAGDRGFNALKVYRLDLAKGFYDRLSNEEKADPNTAKEIAKLVNHSTGTSELDLGRGGVSKFVSTAFFAPKLEASRWQGLIGDPAKAAKTFTNWKEASPAEKAGAKLVARNAGEKIATYVALLAANSALLSLMGSKQKINYTNLLSSDWLKFKTGGGKTLDITGGTLASMKLLGTLLDNTVTGYTGNKKELWKKPAEKDYQAIGTQIRYKLSPFASTIADLVETTDAMGRPLPYSNIKPKKGETQYTVGSYLLQQQTPIPISAGIREAIGSMKERGMTNVQIQDALMGALYFTVEGFTGAKLGNEPKKKK